MLVKVLMLLLLPGNIAIANAGIDGIAGVGVGCGSGDEDGIGIGIGYGTGAGVEISGHFGAYVFALLLWQTKWQQKQELRIGSKYNVCRYTRYSFFMWPIHRMYIFYTFHTHPRTLRSRSHILDRFFAHSVLFLSP